MHLAGCGSTGTTVTSAAPAPAPITPDTPTVPTVLSLDVTPESASLARGTTQGLTATATLSDGTTLNVTSQVAWTSSDPTLASVDPVGVATGLIPGGVTIAASLAGLQDQAQLTITDASLQQLVVSPPSATLAAGTSQQLTALGIFSDQSVQDLTAGVTWTATGAASVDNLGRATGTVPGNAQVAAAFDGQSSAAELTVSDAVLTGLDIQPNGANLTPGAVQAFTVTGTLSDGSTQNLTGSALWSSTGNVAANVFTAGATGNYTVTATEGGLSQTVAVQVTQGTGPVLITGHNRTMFRLLGFGQNPATGELTPIATGYPQDSAAFPGSPGTLVQLTANPVFRTAIVTNRLASNTTAGALLTVNPDGTSSNMAQYTAAGPNAPELDWSPDGRLLTQPVQVQRLGLIGYGPDGAFLGSSIPPADLMAPITGVAMARTARWAHASTATTLYTVPINNPAQFGMPVALAQTGLNSLEAGPQGRTLYGIANNDEIRVFTLSLTTGQPTLQSTLARPGARELLLAPDGRFLYCLTNGPDEVWVYPINQANFTLNAPVGPFPAGTTPTGLTTDRAGRFLYLASSGDDQVVAYAVNQVSGQLTPVGGSPFSTGQTGLSDVMMLP